MTQEQFEREVVRVLGAALDQRTRRRREYHREYCRRWRADNPSHVREYNRRQRQRLLAVPGRREYLRERHRQWVAANKPRMRALQRNWIEKKRARIKTEKWIEIMARGPRATNTKRSPKR